MLTPGRTAFVSSTAVPMIEPSCARATDAMRHNRATRIDTRENRTGPPLTGRKGRKGGNGWKGKSRFSPPAYPAPPVPPAPTSPLRRRARRSRAIQQLTDLVQPTVRDDASDFSGVADARERIAVDDDQVGELAGFDGSRVER